MAAELVWRPRAREDLFNIYEFIALDDQAAAEQLITSIETKAAMLAQYPRLGLRRPGDSKDHSYPGGGTLPDLVRNASQHR